MSAKFTLIDLINQVGLENIRVQPLLGSVTHSSTNKKGETRLTFITKEITTNELLYDGKNKTGLILWMPKDRVQIPPP